MPRLRYWFGIDEHQVDFVLPTAQLNFYLRALEHLPPMGATRAIMVTED